MIIRGTNTHNSSNNAVMNHHDNDTNNEHKIDIIMILRSSPALKCAGDSLPETSVLEHHLISRPRALEAEAHKPGSCMTGGAGLEPDLSMGVALPQDLLRGSTEPSSGGVLGSKLWW